MTAALLAVLALLSAAEPPAGAATSGDPAGSAAADQGAAAGPAGAVEADPAPAIDPAPPLRSGGPEATSRRPARTLAGLGGGLARGVIDGLALRGATFEAALDVHPGALYAFDGLRLALGYGAFRTPGGLHYSQWRPSLSFFWSLGALRAALGGGVSLATLEKATSGTVASLDPFGRLVVGAEAGPFGPVAPFVELEGSAQAGVWQAGLRAGLRWDLAGGREAP